MISTLFDNLDRWRHLPNYQLERRADIFFSLYLREVVEAHTGVELLDTLIPELPIKRDLIWPETKSNQSVKVDYLLVAQDLSRAFLVELKTDVSSRRDKQDVYLERAAELGLGSILEGLRTICTRTTAHQKYHHLLAQLAGMGLLALPDGLAEHTFPKPKRGLTRSLRQVEVTVPDEMKLEVVYVQPTGGEDERVIDFEEFADVVERYGDAMSQRFGESLGRWWRVEAGSERP